MAYLKTLDAKSLFKMYEWVNTDDYIRNLKKNISTNIKFKFLTQNFTSWFVYSFIVIFLMTILTVKNVIYGIQYINATSRKLLRRLKLTYIYFYILAKSNIVFLNIATTLNDYYYYFFLTKQS